LAPLFKKCLFQSAPDAFGIVIMNLIIFFPWT
jgi:hypothetical protein